MRGSCALCRSSLTSWTVWPRAGTTTSRSSKLLLRSINKDHLGKGVYSAESIHCYVLFPSPHSWVWAEGGQNFDFEQSVDVGGFGYPVSSSTVIKINDAEVLLSFI